VSLLPLDGFTSSFLDSSIIFFELLRLCFFSLVGFSESAWWSSSCSLPLCFFFFLCFSLEGFTSWSPPSLASISSWFTKSFFDECFLCFAFLLDFLWIALEKNASSGHWPSSLSGSILDTRSVREKILSAASAALARSVAPSNATVNPYSEKKRAIIAIKKSRNS